MSTLLEFVAWNSLVALVLAVLVTLAGRVSNRPELLHLLWLIVLVKLVTPGVVQWAALPDVLGTTPAPLAGPPLASLPVDELPAAVPVAEQARAWGWTEVSAAAWIGGSALFLLLVMSQCVRFARAMRAAEPAGRGLGERIGRLARRLGVARPRALVLDATVPPMVWGGLGGSTLVLPARLLAALDDDEIDTLITHELAHVKRRDPWIRWVELAVTGALWWNPLVWWVRKRLRRAEEEACDRRVLEVFPHAHRAYANGIVKTVEFLAGRARTPQFATGAVGTRHIKERLIMILKPSSKNRRLRHPLLPALLLAVLVLPVVPGFAEREDRGAEEARAELLALQREALELEQRLHRIQAEQDQLRMRLGETRGRSEAVEVEAKLAHVEMERARELAQQAELMDRERRMGEAELEMREALIDYERARAEQDASAAEHYERALAEHKRQLGEEAIALEEARRVYERALRMQGRDRSHSKLDELASHYAELREQGRDEEADELAKMLQMLQVEMADRELDREKAGAYRDQMLAQIEELRVALEHAGDGAERDALEREIEALNKTLQQLERRVR